MADSQDTTPDDVPAEKLPANEHFTSPWMEEQPMTAAEIARLRRSNPKTYVIPGGS